MSRFKIVKERLDWKGDVVREEYERDVPEADVDVSGMLAAFVKTGELDFHLAKTTFDTRRGLDACEIIAPAPSPTTAFGRAEPGVVSISCEFPTLSARYVVYDARRHGRLLGWIRDGEEDPA